jgi:hypothetical protein
MESSCSRLWIIKKLLKTFSLLFFFSLTEHCCHCVLRSFRFFSFSGRSHLLPSGVFACNYFVRLSRLAFCACLMMHLRLFCVMTRFLQQDSNILRLPGHISNTSFPEPSWLASARAAHNAPQHSITWRGSSSPASTSLTLVALETPFVFSALNCVFPPHVFLAALVAELPFHSHRSSPTTGVSNDAGLHTAPDRLNSKKFQKKCYLDKFRRPLAYCEWRAAAPGLACRAPS